MSYCNKEKKVPDEGTIEEDPKLPLDTPVAPRKAENVE